MIMAVMSAPHNGLLLSLPYHPRFLLPHAAGNLFTKQPDRKRQSETQRCWQMERDRVKWEGVANLTWSAWQCVHWLQGQGTASCELREWGLGIGGGGVHCRKGERWGGGQGLGACEGRSGWKTSAHSCCLFLHTDCTGKDSAHVQAKSRTVNLPLITSFIELNAFFIHKRIRDLSTLGSTASMWRWIMNY